jgi:hypothetical protein
MLVSRSDAMSSARGCRRTEPTDHFFEDIKVALMGALGVDVRGMLDLGKHAFTEAFERERVDAPQHLPVGFRNGACHGAAMRKAIAAIAP